MWNIFILNAASAPDVPGAPKYQPGTHRKYGCLPNGRRFVQIQLLHSLAPQAVYHTVVKIRIQFLLLQLLKLCHLLLLPL